MVRPSFSFTVALLQPALYIQALYIQRVAFLGCYAISRATFMPISGRALASSIDSNGSPSCVLGADIPTDLARVKELCIFVLNRSITTFAQWRTLIAHKPKYSHSPVSPTSIFFYDLAPRGRKCVQK